VELVAAAQITLHQTGEITVPGRKLYDIVRTLPQRTQVTLTPASHQSRPHPRCHG
jgi:DNA polymerase III sliding clamp (beta) subunit (PCNA family)